jgi:Domain of unknown function (DUF5655)
VGVTDRGAGPAAFLEGTGLGLAVYRRVLDAEPGADVRVTRTQLAFSRERAFAWLWRPRRWLGPSGAEIVLSIALPRHDLSPRWKQVSHPTPRAWMHHLEVSAVEQVDEEVVAWLHEAAVTAAAR